VCIHFLGRTPNPLQELAASEGELTANQSLASIVGASLLAKDVNDDAFQQDERGAFESFAGKPAPTEGWFADSVFAFDLDLPPLSLTPNADVAQGLARQTTAHSTFNHQQSGTRKARNAL
jgi:hypothetical protein